MKHRLFRNNLSLMHECALKVPEYNITIHHDICSTNV